MSSAATAPLQWDVFCQVIDNYGDIGVCWRLASQLAAHGERVRLWVDDASALAWMAPAGHPGVELRPWGGELPGAHEAAPDVLVEAFGCEIPEPFLAWAVGQATGQQPAWINLEYLSAESYVERNHRLPSLVMSGPARGWTRWFFYPGFTPATGGLLREPGLLNQRSAGFADTWRAAQPAAATAPERWMSLFCYEPPALPALLAQALQPGAVVPTRLLVTPGRATAAVQAALSALPAQHGTLQLQYLQPTDQQGFDDLLHACDFNAVRGEDSLVRALWAGKALVWHIYPQDDGAHHAKLAAFLDWLAAPASLRDFHAAWNGIPGHGPLVVPDGETLAEWTACIQAARTRLVQQSSLVDQLVGFVLEKR